MHECKLLHVSEVMESKLFRQLVVVWQRETHGNGLELDPDSGIASAVAVPMCPWASLI